MRVSLLTREYPPAVYGGAGVHVTQLVRALADPEFTDQVSVDVHCLGEPRPGATAHSESDPRLLAVDPRVNPTLPLLTANVEIAASVAGSALVHSHTWYTNFGGRIAQLVHGIPHVVTAHSLEPRRPWKAEQLAGGYRVSSFVEKEAFETADAVIAVSNGMRADVLDCYPEVDPARVHVVYNGIDTGVYRPDSDTSVLTDLGVDLERPYVTFVGRITRQKGVGHLLAAARDFDPALQLVLLAGAPDTPELARDTEAAVAELQASRTGVVWVREMLPVDKVIQVLTHALVFCCPSIYEPQGIVNLEAMACETAVVASDVGGIPEVVRHGETGLIVPYREDDPTGFAAAFAAAVNELADDPDRAAAMGSLGREVAVADFGWPAIARETLRVYRSVTGGQT
jgi:alpha-maltose-1-phosphate synthase